MGGSASTKLSFDQNVWIAALKQPWSSRIISRPSHMSSLELCQLRHNRANIKSHWSFANIPVNNPTSFMKSTNPNHFSSLPTTSGHLYC